MFVIFRSLLFDKHFSYTLITALRSAIRLTWNWFPRSSIDGDNNKQLQLLTKNVLECKMPLFSNVLRTLCLRWRSEKVRAWHKLICYSIHYYLYMWERSIAIIYDENTENRASLAHCCRRCVSGNSKMLTSFCISEMNSYRFDDDSDTHTHGVLEENFTFL